MSAPIKRYGIFMSPYGCPYLNRTDSGAAVFYNDHLAAMAAASAYDEEKERELCHQFMQDNACSGPYSYEDMWLACAKARAKTATATPENK